MEGLARHGTSPEPHPDGAVACVVARLPGPSGRAARERLVAELRERPGLTLRLGNRGLRLPSSGQIGERLASAVAEGRAWLAREGADVLLWGEASDEAEGTILHFLPVGSDIGGIGGSFGAGDRLDLPAAFDDEFVEVAHGSLLAAGLSTRSPPPPQVVEYLKAAATRIEVKLAVPPVDATRAQTASLRCCAGNCLAAVWWMTGEDGYIEKAIHAYKLALDSCTREESPLYWALIQNHLGNAHESIASRAKDDANLEAAATAYRAVVGTLSPEHHAPDWAVGQRRLGSILYRLALRRGGEPQAFRAAISAFDAALKVLDKKATPERWGDTANQLGVALMDFGSQVAGTEALERAAVVFREVLEVRDREAAPLAWAQTVNNLGATSFALFKRAEDVGMLHDALTCFEGAREVYERHGDAKTAAVIEKNLHRAQGLMRGR